MPAAIANEVMPERHQVVESALSVYSCRPTHPYHKQTPYKKVTHTKGRSKIVGWLVLEFDFLEALQLQRQHNRTYQYTLTLPPPVTGYLHDQPTNSNSQIKSGRKQTAKNKHPKSRLIYIDVCYFLFSRKKFWILFSPYPEKECFGCCVMIPLWMLSFEPVPLSEIRSGWIPIPPSPSSREAGVVVRWNISAYVCEGFFFIFWDALQNVTTRVWHLAPITSETKARIGIYK